MPNVYKFWKLQPPGSLRPVRACTVIAVTTRLQLKNSYAGTLLSSKTRVVLYGFETLFIWETHSQLFAWKFYRQTTREVPTRDIFRLWAEIWTQNPKYISMTFENVVPAWENTRRMLDFRLPPQSKWDLWSIGMLDCLTLEDGTDGLFRNVGNL